MIRCCIAMMRVSSAARAESARAFWVRMTWSWVLRSLTMPLVAQALAKIASPTQGARRTARPVRPSARLPALTSSREYAPTAFPAPTAA